MTDGMKHLFTLAFNDAMNQDALMSMLRVWQNYNGSEITATDACEAARLICRVQDGHPKKSAMDVFKYIDGANQ